MSDTTEVDSPQRISRRSVVKGGLVVGGALWAVPAVQVLTATKAFASTASGGTTSDVGISYVMLVLNTAADVVITAKVDQDGSVTCPGSASGDIGSRWDNYLHDFPTHTNGGCPADLFVVSHSETSVTVDLGGNTLLGFMVHDGSLPHDTGKVGFASWTTLPADSIALPGTWTAPGKNATGVVTFAEPA